MVRLNQTSNPRTSVVLSAGADWRTRAAGQRRVSGAEFPMPRRPAARLKALQQCLGVIRAAINTKRWAQARHGISRARALVSALPGELTAKEREQLSVLRKRFEARGTTTAEKSATKKKTTPKPAAKKVAPRKKTAPGKAAPPPAPDLGDRRINRASLGYGPAGDA
ncbi:hypothetical protein [Streptomyces sp. SM11]|uniref:hypothetical protein n=1 Tax=Streptomyces sp. SM11 TaxID=565557 RepID=UPI000CD53724|nr:hypothetical protein [Streptomyces sp. SM11]